MDPKNWALPRFEDCDWTPWQRNVAGSALFRHAWFPRGALHPGQCTITEFDPHIGGKRFRIRFKDANRHFYVNGTTWCDDELSLQCLFMHHYPGR